MPHLPVCGGCPTVLDSPMCWGLPRAWAIHSTVASSGLPSGTLTYFMVLSLSLSPGSPDSFTPGLSPATETTRSPMAPPSISQCQTQLLSMPFNPAALMLPTPVAHGRLLHIAKIGCQLERQCWFLLDHSSVCRP